MKLFLLLFVGLTSIFANEIKVEKKEVKKETVKKKMHTKEEIEKERRETAAFVRELFGDNK